MKPIRSSSLQLVAVRIGSNQLFALRIALRIASQRNGLVRIGRVWRWARDQKELTRTDETQYGTDTVVIACRAESLLFTAWRYDAVQFTSRNRRDSYGLQRCITMEWDEIRIRWISMRMTAIHNESMRTRTLPIQCKTKVINLKWPPAAILEFYFWQIPYITLKQPRTW